MSSATLLRAYRLAVQREAFFAPRGYVGNTSIPDYVLSEWAVYRSWCDRYAQLQRRLESRLLTRLGATGA